MCSLTGRGVFCWAYPLTRGFLGIIWVIVLSICCIHTCLMAGHRCTCRGKGNPLPIPGTAQPGCSCRRRMAQAGLHKVGSPKSGMIFAGVSAIGSGIHGGENIGLRYCVRSGGYSNLVSVPRNTITKAVIVTSPHSGFHFSTGWNHCVHCV